MLSGSSASSHILLVKVLYATHTTLLGFKFNSHCAKTVDAVNARTVLSGQLLDKHILTAVVFDFLPFKAKPIQLEAL